MKNITLLFFLTNITLFAQVGIGTTSPKQTLHVAGSNSTIRIDGLNSTDNTNNDGYSDAAVYVNANGDLILKPATPTAILNLLGAAIVNPAVILSGSNVTQTIKSGNFTNTKDGFVGLSFSLSVTDITDTSGKPLSDGRPRILALLIYIDGNLVARASQAYTCSNISGTIANGYLVLNGHHYADLTKGNHTYSVDAKIYGGTHSFKATFGGSASFNNFQILEF